MSETNPGRAVPANPDSTAELVREYYNRGAQVEWRRLSKDPYHRLEFETTLHFLAQYLPESGLVLDAGGGPGRYTLALARRGYELVLLDVAPENIALARRLIKRAGLRRKVKDTLAGSMVDLSCFPDASFDAVLCTGGPLSHILDAGEREKAVSELVRVAKPKAPLFVSVIGRLGLLVTELIQMPEEIALPFFKPMRDSGDYFGGRGFTACHFFLPEELQEVFSRQPVEILAMAGLEGISSHHPRELNRLAKNETRFAAWLETHYLTCTHPSVVGLSEHMLIVVRKWKRDT